MTRTPLREEHIQQWESAVYEWRMRPLHNSQLPPRLTVELDQAQLWMVESEPSLRDTPLASGLRQEDS